jgi:hypothetical protein
MDIAGIVLGYIAVIGGLAIAPLAIIMGIRHDRQKRELEHMERMRALELGRRLPQDEPWLSPMKIALVIGGFVPLVVFSSVATATARTGFHDGMWVAACLVGTAAVIAGSCLAGNSLKRDATSTGSLDNKPYVEEDAYDVVSSRG